jgi:hypothetical protein
MKALLIGLAALISTWKKDSRLANMPTNPAATSGWSIRYSPTIELWKLIKSLS